MQSYDENLARLCAILQPHAKDGAPVVEDTVLATELGLDSAQFLELILEIEELFDISIPLNVLPNVSTVKDLVLELEKLLGSGQ